MLDDLPRNPNFVGREQTLEAIGESLLPPSQASIASEVGGLKVLALCGMGGIGKTEIAVEFAHRHKSKFDAVLWAQAGSRHALEKSLWQIAVRLGLLDPSENQDPKANKETLRSWLSNPRMPVAFSEGYPESSPFQATWLLVFDGADDPFILRDFWTLHRGCILITSRDPRAKIIFPSSEAGLDLKGLQKKESTALLNKMTKKIVNEGTAADSLVQLLGGLPLAIAQIANISASRNLSLGEIYKLYNQPDQHAKLHGTSIDLYPSVYSHNLATVWKMETLNPSARTLLDVLSFLDPVQVSEQLLIDIDHVPRALDFPRSRKSFNRARDELMQSSLMKWSQEGLGFTLHGLVQDVAIAKFEEERFSTLFSFTVFLHEKGYMRDIDELLKTSTEICEELNHTDKDTLLIDTHFVLGAIAADTNQHKASRWHKEVSYDLQLGVSKNIRTVDERLILSLVERAVSRIQDGHYDEAIKWLLGAQDARRKLFTSCGPARQNTKGVMLPGPEVHSKLLPYWPSELEAYLGLAYLMLDRWNESEAVLIEALQFRRQALGEKDVDSYRQALALSFMSFRSL
ncbi:MAG: hypothetical protein Q9216_004508 [Gyalolechia sp. 2 TL-2023]